LVYDLFAQASPSLASQFLPSLAFAFSRIA
jgi:hypothetical protein